MWNRLAPYVLRLFGRHGPVEEQILTIYIGTNGYLDSLEIGQVKKFLVELVATEATKDYLNRFFSNDKLQLHHRNYKKRVLKKCLEKRQMYRTFQRDIIPDYSIISTSANPTFYRPKNSFT